MKITKIKILKNKVNVYFDNIKMELDKEVYPNFYLYIGKEVSKKEYNQIKEYNNVASLLKYALRIRSKAVYSEYQIREKLYKKEASKKEVDKVIKSLKQYDLIDDKAFAFDLVEYYNSLNYGENKIKKKLSDKGIFDEVISKLSFPRSAENRKAKNLLPKLERKYSKYNDSQKRSHIYNAYLLEGFDVEIAKTYSNMISKSSMKEENEKLEKDFSKVYTRLSKKNQKKELKQKVITSLLSKGYKLNDIMKIVERKF